LAGLFDVSPSAMRTRLDQLGLGEDAERCHCICHRKPTQALDPHRHRSYP
jgi:hypothetical protein